MKKNIRGITLALGFSGILSFAGISQNQGKNWQFGNKATINFNSGTAVTGATAAYNGAYGTAATTSDEGIASISDGTGATLFYTDGQTVYNKLNNVMSNGTGLLGNTSSTQSGIIVPKPGSSTQYFVFTVDAFSGANKIKYNIVDMTLNGGLGDVVTSKKNILMPNVLATDSFAEKITAVPKASGIGFWLIAHLSREIGATGTFVVWEIGCGTTNDGIAVPSSAIARQNIGTKTTKIYANELGYMKISPDFQQLAYACSGANFAEVLNFNNSTGVLSNPRKVTTATLGAGCLPYGVEFSPNSQYVYIGDLYHGPKIIRYDLTQPILDVTSAAIVYDASYTTGGSDLTQHGSTLWPSYYTLGSLQYAPDGNIYGALPGKDHLLKITNPNAVNPVINESGLALPSPAYCAAGLPNFVTSFLGNAWITVTGPPCSYTLTYAGSTNIPNATYLWNFGDGTTSTLSSPQHAYIAAGSYVVTLTVTDPSTGCSASVNQTIQTIGCGCQASIDPIYKKILTNTTISVNTIWDDKIYIADNVIVTVDNGATLDITNVDVVFGHAAGIDFKNGAVIRANNSVFRPCSIDEVWRGLDFYSTNGTSPAGTINECTFKNAKTALEAYSTSGSQMVLDMRITNNLFADCQRGISLTAIDVKRAITGNTYMADNKNLPFNTFSSQSNSSSSIDYYGIYSGGTNYTDVISQNDFVFTSNAGSNSSRMFGIYMSSGDNATITDNKFTDFVVGIYGNYNRNISVENNTFTWSKAFNMASTAGNKVQVLINYATNVLIKGNNIYNSNVMNSSTVSLPNTANANIGIASNGSSFITVSQNNVNGCETGMSFNGISGFTNQYLFVTENEINKAWYYGIYVASYADVDITCNVVNMELNSTRDVTGICYNNLVLSGGRNGNYYMSTTNVAIRSNCVYNSKNGIYCYNQNSLVVVPMPKVYNNFVYNYRQFGFENNSYSAVATTSPREVYHNSFISNNSGTGTVDINTDPLHVINLEANFGVQNSNTYVNMSLANTQASSASCANQVGTYQNTLNSYNGAQLCTYYFTGVGTNSWSPVARTAHLNIDTYSVPSLILNDGINVIDPIHTTGLEIINYKEQMFDVYPNPATDKIDVHYNIEKVDNAYLEFVDIQGRVVKNYPLSYETVNMVIDVKDLTSGVYILRMVNSAKAVFYSKLIKN